KRNWRVVVFVEILFLIAFGFWSNVRALNPTITATEKPMEFAFLNSVLRTQTIPPADPWLSGYAISYYHFGYIIVAMLTALSGVMPSVAFNLAIAMLFALTAVGAFGVVYNLIAICNPQSAIRNLQTPISNLFSSLLAPLFILLGNINGFFEVLHKGGILPAEFWKWLDIKWTNEVPIVSSSWMPDRFLWWWQASRVIHDRDLLGREVEVIDEFPFFSFLLGDMHPHVLALPFVFLALAFALNLFLMARESETPSVLETLGVWKKWMPLHWHDLLAGAIILGGLSFLNTWDFLIYLFIVMASYTVARSLRGGWTREVWRDSVLVAAQLAVLGVVLYLPFYIGFRSQLGGILPNPIFGSRVQQFVVMFGPSLFVICCLMGWLAYQRRAQLDWRGGFGLAIALLITLVAVSITLTFAISLNLSPEAQGTLASLIGDGKLQDLLMLALLRPLEVELLAVSLLLTALIGLALAYIFAESESVIPSPAGARNLSDDPRDSSSQRLVLSEAEGALPGMTSPLPDISLFTVILILTAALLTLGPEFVYLRDLFGTRMNTIFKFYYQAWVLWSLAAAFGTWLLARAANRIGATIFTLGAGVVILLGLIYPVLATTTITDNWRGTTRNADGLQYATLDGMAYMQTVRAADYAAINFLNARVQGRPVIAEAVGGSYTEFARISVHSGLPTVIGWPFHEFQWRGNTDVFGGRENEIRILYQANTFDEVKPIMDKYNIRYVYVGLMEAGAYGGSGLGKFAGSMKIIYQDQGVTIYERVDK
ncbi:MAG: hypothetical protein HZB17_02100, partial [Chloroflexi bacterium]|nr:hypothetical protein [Chloroflexota bacterium]